MYSYSSHVAMWPKMIYVRITISVNTDW